MLEVVLYNSKVNYDKKSHHNNKLVIPTGGRRKSQIYLRYCLSRSLHVANVMMEAPAHVQPGKREKVYPVILTTPS